MKTKISKKVISICLTLLICISALPLSMLSASAAEYDITIRNVVYPRPGAVPQADIKKESVSLYNLYGWAWMGSDDTVAMGPDEKFKDFFSLVLGSAGDCYYELDTFNDTVSYSLSLMFVLKDKIVISGVECDVVFYDENNTVRGVTQGMFLPVKYARTYAEEAGIRWQLFNKVLSDDYPFYCGDTIALLIGLAPKEGYELYVTSGCINGINSVDAIHLTDGRQYLQFEINITAPDEYKTQNIELSVAEPVAGVKPSTTAVCTSGYAIPGTPSWTPADTTFKSGTQYTVKIPVTAEHEWGDTSTVTAKVNGKEAKFIAEYKGGKQYAYYVEYTFDATKDYMLGDVNLDGVVTIDDATLVQKYLAGISELDDPLQLLAADVDSIGEITIDDSTRIQKYLVGLIDKF